MVTSYNRQRYNANRREKKNRLRSMGLCGCGAPARAGFTMCPPCAENKRARSVQYAASSKQDVVANYGGECACCGEHRIPLLTVDHIIPYADGGGPRAYRAGAPLYGWLRRNNYPEGFRVLCMSYNFVRNTHICCPHEAERGFVGFVHGKQFHYYVQASSKLYDILSTLVSLSPSEELIEEALERIVKRYISDISSYKEEADVEVAKSEW